MTLDVSLSELTLLVSALLVGGLVTGFMAGLLGIGGGGIIVPILYELFRLIGVDEAVRMHLCVGTSLAIIIPTSIRAFRSHRARGAVEMTVLRQLAPWVVVGVLVGIAVTSQAPASVLKLAFVVSTLFMAAQLAFKTAMVSAEPKLPRNGDWNIAVGFVTGMISTLVGIGGGAYVSGYMTYRGWSIHKAVGTASGFGPIIAIPGVIGYIVSGWGSMALPPLSVGFVSLLGFAIIAPVTVLAAPIGVKIAHRLSRRSLERIFIGFLLAVAARFSASLVGLI